MLHVPTAVGDSTEYDRRASTSCSRARGELVAPADFPWPPADLRELVLSQDAISVGGGNTANMLAIWRVHGFDALLREAWESGVVLFGASAGMICWFEAGVTDSFGPQLEGMRDGLGFLAGQRLPALRRRGAAAAALPRARRRRLPGRARRRRRRRAALRRHRARRGRHLPPGSGRLPRHARRRGAAGGPCSSTSRTLAGLDGGSTGAARAVVALITLNWLLIARLRRRTSMRLTGNSLFPASARVVSSNCCRRRQGPGWPSIGAAVIRKPRWQ